MKFYVAGKYEERETIRQLQLKLIQLGHEITVDWTDHKRDDPEYPGGYAHQDVWGVKNADAFIGYFVNKNHYKGALVEMGVALGNFMPVYIIGRAVDSCIFIHHSRIRQFEDMESFLGWLREQ